MERERIREQVRAVVLDRLGPKNAEAPRAAAAAASPAPVDVVSWRRFDDPRDAARRPLVTEADVMRARTGGKVLPVSRDAIVTPLARETAGRLGVKIEAGTEGPAPAAQAPAAATPAAAARKTVALAADHGGFALKERLRPFVAGLGFEVIDLGTKDANPVDYPDFAHQVARAVRGGRASFGIMVDGVGVGSAMAANRHAGVRAAPCSTTLQAQSAREHNDANVLTLGGRHLGEDVALAIVKSFLETAFAGGRHVPRVEKIDTPAKVT
jgi:ribose 5-phosphate isomerase B